MIALASVCFSFYELKLMIPEQKTIFLPERLPLSFTFLVFSGASIMCVASAIDPLRAANRICGENVFRWKIVSPDNEPPVTSAGLPIAVDSLFDPDEKADVLIVIGGFGTRNAIRKKLKSDLRQAARNVRAVGGVEAGSWVLGRVGLLKDRAATTHWEDLEDFAANFPECNVRPDRYVIDGPILTAGGASPIFDLMLHLIRTRLGMAVALDVASVFIYDQTSTSTDAQPLVSLGRLQDHDPKLAQAIRIMESSIDRPLTTFAIARRLGMSTRALEKAFGRTVGETPGAYNLRLRLNVARRLVLNTTEPMTVIAIRTGFTSAATFSRAFSRAFATSPVKMRQNSLRESS